MNPFDPHHPPTAINDHPLSHRGRFGRLSYIAWHSFLNIVAFLAALSLSIIFGIFSLSTYSWDYLGTAIFEIANWGSLLFVLAYFYFSFVITIRRLHDLNLSGWWSLLSLIPLLNIFFFIYLLCRSGDSFYNTYGATRLTAFWEKVLAWLVILCGALFLFSLGSLSSYIMQLDQIPTPTKLLPKSTDFF